METLSLILLGLAFIFFCLMSAILLRQNEQLRKDLKAMIEANFELTKKLKK
jgi:hypothetical protein